MDGVCNDCSVVVSAVLGSKVLMEKSGIRDTVDTVDIIGGGIKLNVVVVSPIVDGVIVVTVGLAVFTSL